MKQLVCEMCGSTDLMKDGGVFVCQSCGVKYSVEEARKMMVEGTVEVTGTVQVNKTRDAEHYLELAENMLKSGNWSQAEQYAAKTLEVSTDNARAWFIRGCAVDKQSTLAEDKLPEMVSCFRKIAEKLGNDLSANGRFSSDSDMNIFLEITVHSLSSMKNRIDLWTSAFGQAPGDANARDRLTLMLPAALDGYRAMLAYIENTVREHKEAIKSSFMANGATAEQADEFIAREQQCYDNAGSMYVYAINRVISTSIPDAGRKMASVVANASGGLPGKYAAVGACEDAAQNTTKVFEAAKELCDAPVVEYYLENSAEGQIPVGVSALHYLLACAHRDFLNSYKNLRDIKQSIAGLANMPKDSAGEFAFGLKCIMAETEVAVWDFEQRKLTKAKEMSEAAHRDAVEKKRKEAYDNAFANYPKTHRRDLEDLAQKKKHLSDIEQEITRLREEVSSLGLFKASQKRQLNSKIVVLREDEKKALEEIKRCEEKREAYAKREADKAAQAAASNFTLSQGEGLLAYDVMVNIGTAPDALKVFSDLIWKSLHIPIGRFSGTFNEGSIILATDITYDYITNIKKALQDTEYRIILKPSDYEHAVDGKGFSVTVNSIDQVAAGVDEDDSASVARAKRSKRVTYSVSRYIPIAIESNEKNFTTPKTLANDLPEKLAYALAADLEIRGAKVTVRQQAK